MNLSLILDRCLFVISIEVRDWPIHHGELTGVIPSLQGCRRQIPQRADSSASLALPIDPIPVPSGGRKEPPPHLTAAHGPWLLQRSFSLFATASWGLGRRILERISPIPVPVPKLASQTSPSAASVDSMLMEAECDRSSLPAPRLFRTPIFQQHGRLC